MIGFLWGLLGGFIAWLATAILGQPLYTFLNLRSEAAKILALYERQPSLPPTLSPNRAVSLEQWQLERKRSYQECGARLVALGAANFHVVTAILHRMRFYPEAAGMAFLMLSEQPADLHAPLEENISSSLRLKASVSQR